MKLLSYMPKAVNETLDAFLQRQEVSTLCTVLLELPDLLTTGDKAGTTQAIRYYAQLIQQPQQETTR